jgi:hypothetical protein
MLRSSSWPRSVAGVDDDRYAELGPLAFSPGPAPAPADPTPAAAAPVGLRPGSRRVPGTNGRDFAYIGLVRDGHTVIVECGHTHNNRDWNGATDCARAILAGAANPNVAAATAETIRYRWTGLTRAAGHTHGTATITAAKTAAHADADAYLAAVDTVRTATR